MWMLLRFYLFSCFALARIPAAEWYMLTVWGRHAIASSQQPTTGKNYARLLHFFRFYSCFLSLGTIFLRTQKAHTHSLARSQSFSHPLCFSPTLSDSNKTKHFKVGKCLDFSSIECHTMNAVRLLFSVKGNTILNNTQHNASHCDWLNERCACVCYYL